MHPEAVVLDFDSTFIQSESLEVLAEIALKHHPEGESRLREIRELTRQGMEGTISFAEGLSRRLRLLDATRKELDQAVEQLRWQVTPSIVRNRRFLQQNRDSIYIVSSGFYEMIHPIACSYGIRPDHIYANRFLFDYEGCIVGCDPNNPLVRDGGKAEVVRQLGLQGKVVVIGDGFTDLEVRENGAAHKFYAFTENVHRENIAAKADHVLTDFEAYLSLHAGSQTVGPRQGNKALLLEGVHPSAAQRLAGLGLEVERVAGALSEAELIARLPEVAVLGIRSKTRLTKRVIENAPQLLAVGAFCIGTNQIDLATCTEYGIAAFNAPYSNTRSVVELAIGQIIMLFRQTFDQSRNLHNGIWNKSAHGSHEIRGKTLGIIGYGNIGSQLSILAEALGMHVLYHDLEEKLPLGNAQACATLPELLKRSDVVSVHVDGRAQNAQLIGRKELSQMRKGAFLLNLSRGHVVDIDALVDALRSGQLSGASVDVYPEEPDTNAEKMVTPLQGLPNVLLTPHIGGSTEEAQENIGDFVAGRLSDYLERGSTVASVNFPQIQLPPLAYAHRLIHIHRNVPGQMAAITKLMAERKINIEAQYLQTNETIGYVIMDVNTPYEASHVEALQAIPETIHVRALY